MLQQMYFPGCVVNQLASRRPSAMSFAVSHPSTIQMFASAANQQKRKVVFSHRLSFCSIWQKAKFFFLKQENVVLTSVRLMKGFLKMKLSGLKSCVVAVFVHGNSNTCRRQ